MHLLPKVKKLETKNGYLSKGYIAPYTAQIDERLKKAIEKLPCGADGVELVINTKGTDSEAYTISIEEHKIEITSDGLNGAFYAIQTLRQILKHDTVPCLFISDKPDFAYRGFYQDITRGRVHKLETLKKLVDDMAYYKLNSLQLYVEHVFEFEETKELIERTGYITKEEIRELDAYCAENFIEFIPSLATFGHMYEILEQDQYKHLRVLHDFKPTENFWQMRAEHHTIDPQNPESFPLVQSLLDQYYPLFQTDTFNICGDETFDLEFREGKEKAGKLYVDFVKQIIDHMTARGKKIMMWADVVLNHPETIDMFPEDICFLNWNYMGNPPEDIFKTLAERGKKQIVCPGTNSWARMCEHVLGDENNIIKVADYGHKYGAEGVLNTNWGDYGNLASIDLAMYGLVLGAAKSWAVDMTLGDAFYDDVNAVLYGHDNAIQTHRKLTDAHDIVGVYVREFCMKYFELRYDVKAQQGYDIDGFDDGGKKGFEITKEKVIEAQTACMEIVADLSGQTWEYDLARQQIMLCAEGVCVLAQLGAKMCGVAYETVVEPKAWIEKYKEAWLATSKPSELDKFTEMILYIDAM